jgi:hypothetical protein
MLDLFEKNATQSENFFDAVRTIQECFQELIICLGLNFLSDYILDIIVLIRTNLREFNTGSWQFIMVVS